MKTDINEQLSRKEFLSGIGRIMLLLILVFIPVSLISRRKVAIGEEGCEIDLPCKACNKNGNCNLKKEN